MSDRASLWNRLRRRIFPDFVTREDEACSECGLRIGTFADTCTRTDCPEWGRDVSTDSIAPRPWRVVGYAIYDAEDSIVGNGAIREADNLRIVEAVNAYEALRSHIIALGRPDLVGEPFDG